MLGVDVLCFYLVFYSVHYFIFRTHYSLDQFRFVSAFGGLAFAFLGSIFACIC